MEDSWAMTESMLSDVLVCNVYDQFFQQNAVLFKDKIVLDVGCRSGMLSYLAVEAGAVKVIAVGNMKSASYVTKAFANGEKAEIFEPLTGSINTIRLPCGLKKVDIIVSEWMGHALFADSLYSQVLYARDKWLAKHGYIIPNIVNLYISGIAEPRRLKTEQLPAARLLDDYINRECIMTEKYLLRTVNISTVKHEDEFQIDFKLQAVKAGRVTGCMLHMEVGAINAKGQLQKFFSNGPETARTYLKPTLFMLQPDRCLEVVDQQLLVGQFGLALSNFAPRGVEFLLGIWNTTGTEVKLNKGRW